MKTAYFRLTPKQTALLAPLFEAVKAAEKATTSRKEKRGAILGQCFSDGEVGMCFLTNEQYSIVRPAIIKAEELDKPKRRVSRKEKA